MDILLESLMQGCYPAVYSVATKEDAQFYLGKHVAYAYKTKRKIQDSTSTTRNLPARQLGRCKIKKSDQASRVHACHAVPVQYLTL
ncbi:hypothetical protein C8J57DRAFT_1381696 [Mycena rebaudengoi]|nr:hypothetical protein C8J57DRAFT_1381696 [Mycena rebaudengoi]